MATASTCSSILHRFVEKIQLLLQNIRDVEERTDECEEFKHQEFWNKLSAVFKKVSHEATTLSLAFAKAPPPNAQECEGILDSLEKTVIVLVSVYYALPNTQGVTMKKALKKAVINMIEGIKSLAEVLSNSSTGSFQQQLQTTGYVWQEADFFPSLPKNNKEAVLAALDGSSGLVKDALTEIEELRIGGNDGMDDIFGSDNLSELSETEKALLSPCSGLIKTSKFILKKVSEGIKSSGEQESEELVTELDKLAVNVERLSPVVDDFASCLYPPLNHDNIKKEGDQLYKTNEALLMFLKQSQLKTEKLDALLGANKHNWEKISSSLDAV